MMRLAFLINDTGISGGVNVIFEHALNLHFQGHEIYLICNKDGYRPIFWHRIGKFIGKGIDLRTSEEIPNFSFDCCVLTFWKTVYWAYKIKADKYVYFVQSIESRFYSSNELVLRDTVEATYDLNLGYVTECNWIADYLKVLYKKNAHVSLNGIDKDIFYPNSKSNKDTSPNRRLRMLVEGPIGVPFKNTEKAIELCVKSGVGDVYLLTSSDQVSFPGVKKVYSQIPIYETGEVYRSCDILVKLSYVEGMFGPPLEMFHCGGTCIVYDVTGHDEYILNNYNGIVIPTDNEDLVVDALRDLKHFPPLLSFLKENALTTAKNWPSWQESSVNFESSVILAMQDSTITSDELYDLYKVHWKRLSLYFKEIRTLTTPVPHAIQPGHTIKHDVATPVDQLLAIKSSTMWIFCQRMKDIIVKFPLLRRFLKKYVAPILLKYL